MEQRPHAALPPARCLSAKLLRRVQQEAWLPTAVCGLAIEVRVSLPEALHHCGVAYRPERRELQIANVREARPDQLIAFEPLRRANAALDLAQLASRGFTQRPGGAI